MLTTSCRVENRMAPTASWSANGENSDNVINFAHPRPKRIPVSILKKAESDSSSTCSNSSMITCRKGCKLKVLNTQLNTHDCFERMRQDLNDAYGKIDDLEEQLRLLRESFQDKETVLRNQIRRLRNDLGGVPDDVGEKICVRLTRENRTFGFKLLGRVENAGSESSEQGDVGVYIASLTHGTPAQQSGKIFIQDQILEINSTDVLNSTCTEVESLIRNSGDTMDLVLLRTTMSAPYSPKTSLMSSSSSTLSLVPDPPLLPTSLAHPPASTPRPHCSSDSHSELAHVRDSDIAQHIQSRDSPADHVTDAAQRHSSSDLNASLSRSLPLRLLSDEDFDNLSAIGLPDETLDSSQDQYSIPSDMSIDRGSDISKLSPDRNDDHVTRSASQTSSPELQRDVAQGTNERLSNDHLTNHLTNDRSTSLHVTDGRGGDPMSSSESRSDATDITDVPDILAQAREYEEITLAKRDGMLGITLTYGNDMLQGALFVDSIKPGSPAAIAGKPLLHDQILKINNKEVGVDIMCDEAVGLLTEDIPAVTLELARPKKHEILIKRKVGQSLGMMVAVSKVEDDKSVIISTVDPNGLVAKYGLFKGLTLHKVNDVELTGLGLKQAVEILAGCVGEIILTVFVHPNFSPYQPPRPPTPYPMESPPEDDAPAERSVKFSLPSSPARSNTSAGSLDSLPRDSSIGSSPGRGRHDANTTLSRCRSSSFDEVKPRVLQPFQRGYGSPSMTLINTDWSLDRSLTSDSKTVRYGNRDIAKGPVRVSHQMLPTTTLPMPVSLTGSLDGSGYNGPVNKNKLSPTPHPSLNNPPQLLNQPQFVNNVHSLNNHRHPLPLPPHFNHPISLNSSHNSLNTSNSSLGTPPFHQPPPNLYENMHRAGSDTEYENVDYRSTPPIPPGVPEYRVTPPLPHPDYRATPPIQYPDPRNTPPPSQGSVVRPGPPLPYKPRVVGRSPQNSPVPSTSTTNSKNRVLGRRERAALNNDRNVQFGAFKPINPSLDDDEHYV